MTDTVDDDPTLEKAAIDTDPEQSAIKKVIQQRKSDAMKKLRSKRDELILSTDKYTFVDYPINEETREKWYHYRQYLRDLPGMSSPDLDKDENLIDVEWDAEKAAEKAAQVNALKEVETLYFVDEKGELGVIVTTG